MRFSMLVVVSGTIVGFLAGPAALRPTSAAETSSDQTAPSAPTTGSDAVRSLSGLQALYDFRSSSGAFVKDQSGVGKPVDLRIAKPEAVHRSEGSIELLGETMIRSDKPAYKIIESVRRSGEITIEAWVRPAKVDQKGPARIVTLSRSGTERNFTLGQIGDQYDVRLWTTETSPNGLPSVSTKSNTVTTELTHVVYTRDRTGRTRFYINGRRSLETTVAGSTINWHGQFRLALGNEFKGKRPWLGTYYLVAIYSRDLLPREVEQHFKAGIELKPGTIPLETKGKLALGPNVDDTDLFESQIAPLLARHCLECHSSNSKEGGLDLSRKDTALAGGESGKAIVPGKAAESLLWEYVESDAMPEDRSPLSAEEKNVLRKWIDADAIWTADTIDPAAYAHDAGTAVNWLRRLTVPEYIETVRSAVGVDIEQDARRLLPPDLRADGFSNTAYNLSVDLGHVEAYAELAEIIVGRMDLVQFAVRFSKSRKLTDKSMRGLIAKMGKWLLRGPLEDHELTTYRGISTTVASAGGDFEEAVRFILEAMLQSPRFIYRVENQRGDGTAWPVGDYELASRLSYTLWGGPPDEELVRAADDGELYDRSGVEAQVRRMLKDPRVVDRSAQFIHQWLNLGRLDNLRPNREKFPNWDPQLAADMRAETLEFFNDVVWRQNRPLADLLNAQVTYVTPRLAAHYRLNPINGQSSQVVGEEEQGAGDPSDCDSHDLKRYDLSPIPSRGGLLTHGSVLTIGGDEASTVTRGLFVLHDLLRGSVKDPPPGLDTTPVPTKPGLSQRVIAEQRIANQSCGGCHSKFEPLAFGLEKFDGLGSYHETDHHGNQLREDGQILIPGQENPVAFQSTAELMDVLADSERVRETITWKLTQFALGRPLVQADVPVVEKIHASAQEGGGTYVSLITAIVMSDLVQTTRTEAE